MRIAYCTTERIPSDRARTFHIAKVVEALQEQGHEVDVYAPYFASVDDLHCETHYGLRSPMRLHRLGASLQAPFALRLPAVGTMIFRYLLVRALRMKKRSIDILYTRSPVLLPALLRLGHPVILELDHLPRFRSRRRFLKNIRRCHLIVTLTSHLRDALIAQGVTSIPVITEGDGVDLHAFDSLPSRDETRTALHVTSSTPLIVYAGQLVAHGVSKGVPELLAAAAILHRRGVDFHLVIAGGPDTVRQSLESTLSDDLHSSVRFLGRLAPLKIPTLLSAADILVYPAPATDSPFFHRDHSPMTLLEYMASGRPIVVADLPPLHDIVEPSMATFFPPGDAEALAEALRTVIADAELAHRHGRLVRSHVERFTWGRRMERILQSVQW